MAGLPVNKGGQSLPTLLKQNISIVVYLSSYLEPPLKQSLNPLKYIDKSEKS